MISDRAMAFTQGAFETLAHWFLSGLVEKE